VEGGSNLLPQVSHPRLAEFILHLVHERNLAPLQFALAGAELWERSLTLRSKVHNASQLYLAVWLYHPVYSLRVLPLWFKQQVLGRRRQACGLISGLL